MTKQEAKKNISERIENAIKNLDNEQKKQD